MKYHKYLFALLWVCCQSVMAQSPQQLKSWLPVIDGWAVTEEIEVFNPDNLFDRINGAAPLFIENNFREMTSMEYKKGKDYITIQVYRHATPEDAFGMYASERTSELTFHEIGGEAQGDKSSLFLFAGNVYIKMWAYAESADAEKILLAIGKGLADKIDPDTAYPAIIKALPQEDKIPYTEAYITANYIGHDFLNRVYLAKYRKNGKEFQLFILDGQSPEGAKDTLTKYYTFARQPLEFAEGTLTIKDRYNGDIPAVWKGRYIIGIFQENGEDTGANGLLEKVAANL